MKVANIAYAVTLYVILNAVLYRNDYQKIDVYGGVPLRGHSQAPGFSYSGADRAM